jgi:hypothetical protein
MSLTFGRTPALIAPKANRLNLKWLPIVAVVISLGLFVAVCASKTFDPWKSSHSNSHAHSFFSLVAWMLCSGSVYFFDVRPALWSLAPESRTNNSAIRTISAEEAKMWAAIQKTKLHSFSHLFRCNTERNLKHYG